MEKKDLAKNKNKVERPPKAKRRNMLRRRIVVRVR